MDKKVLDLIIKQNKELMKEKGKYMTKIKQEMDKISENDKKEVGRYIG